MDAAVALVGLGHMGTAVGERLLDGGYALSVHNRTPGRDAGLVERGASRLGAAGDALARAGVCLLTLADDQAVEAVAAGSGGVLAGARPGTVLVEMSTISVGASRRVAAAAAERGVAYLRAPISGNPGALRSGTATILVSGPRAEADAVEPLLRAIAPNVRYVGDDETARVVKLALQVFVGGTAELLAEALLLGESAGVERRVLLEAIAASVVGSRFVDYKTGPLLADDYSATFTTAMMRKDVGLVLDLAGESGAELPLTGELASLLDGACAAGHADEDFASLVLFLRERAGAAGGRER